MITVESGAGGAGRGRFSSVRLGVSGLDPMTAQYWAWAPGHSRHGSSPAQPSAGLVLAVASIEPRGLLPAARCPRVRVNVMGWPLSRLAQGGGRRRQGQGQEQGQFVWAPPWRVAAGGWRPDVCGHGGQARYECPGVPGARGRRAVRRSRTLSSLDRQRGLSMSLVVQARITHTGSAPPSIWCKYS